MGLFSNAWEFLEDIFKPKNERSASAQAILESLTEEIWYKEMALHIVSEKISSLISSIEWNTYVKREIKQGENWYLFNYEPNPNQSGTEFKKMIAEKLVYNRECLVVEINGKLYVADDFEKIYPSDLGEVKFGNVTIYLTNDDNGQCYQLETIFDKTNSIYMSYQNPSVEQWYDQLTSLYASLIDNVVSSGSSKVKYALKIDTSAAKGLNIDYSETVKQLINDDFKALVSDKNVIVPLYNGFDLDQLNAGSNLAQNASIANKSVNEQIEVYINDVAKAYGMPVNVALGKENEDEYINLMTYCIDPIVEIIEKAWNRRYYGKMQIYKGNRIEINTKNAKHFEILRAGSAFSQLISSGVESINDIRGMLGQELIDPEIGDKHWITRNYSEVGAFVEEAKEFNEKAASGETVSTTGGGLK